MATVHELNQQGQSVWFDTLRRNMIEYGELQRLIDAGVTGFLAHPLTVAEAIVGSTDYDAPLPHLSSTDRYDEVVGKTLILDDVRRVADILYPVYERTGGTDGYVSIYMRPHISHHEESLTTESLQLFEMLDRPNVLITIPMTDICPRVLTTLISQGVSVHVTSLASIQDYDAIAEAYLKGLEMRVASGHSPKVASVASFKIGSIDAWVHYHHPEYAKITDSGCTTAIAIAAVAYAHFRERFQGEGWAALQAQGAQVQRILWSDTLPMSPSYPLTTYVNGLIGADTIIALSATTLQAFLNDGMVAPTLLAHEEIAHVYLNNLAAGGVSFDILVHESAKSTAMAIDKAHKMFEIGIPEKLEQIKEHRSTFTAHLGSYQSAVDETLGQLQAHRILQRIWEHDYTVWSDEPTEIVNRLGWLHSPMVVRHATQKIEEILQTIDNANYTDVLLLGMGGSSLAPEVFSHTFVFHDRNVKLAVLDSTDPAAVAEHANRLDLSRTLFIVSTKSGGTVETFSFFKYFYTLVAEKLGEDVAGDHFIAITDPGSGLVDVAEKYRFRAVLLNDPNIGGRYSALSLFGMFPAAVVGVDIQQILDKTGIVVTNCSGANCPVQGNNTGALLGAIMGTLAKHGRDKVTIIASPSLRSFGVWAEQLIAESMGKNNTGILPVVDEELGDPAVYGDDRLFVYLRDKASVSAAQDTRIAALREAGQPVVQIELRDRYDIGGEFFRWEIATAVAGHIMNIQPFDQPDVEVAKVMARKVVASYKQSGTLPASEPILTENGISAYGQVTGTTLKEIFTNFLGQQKPGDYIAIQAYVHATAATEDVLQRWRVQLRNQAKSAVTVGYGPRFLHSTGQLHKGDNNNGIFIQITVDDPEDLPIPDEAAVPESSMTFGVLKMAQALGDFSALVERERRVLRLHLTGDVIAGIEQIIALQE